MRSLTSLATCAVLVGAGVLGSVSSADASTHHHRSAHRHVHTSPYVALGDSYSSGAGINPLLDVSCSRSSLNYAHKIAEVTKPTSFTDVTCSGAKTSDFYAPQANTDNKAQLAAVTKRTRLVTMTIGGNDENVFTGSFFGCVTETTTTGDTTGNPCEQKYGDTFVKLIRQKTYPNVVRALRAVRHKAPRATVVILGYPQILPPTGSPACTAVTGIAAGDVPWLVHQEKVLNRVIKRAAARTGARYVDTFTPSAGRDACSGPGTRWMEPAVAPVNAYPIHPNAAGEAALANETLATLRRR